jgi:hypothetical protein
VHVVQHVVAIEGMGQAGGEDRVHAFAPGSPEPMCPIVAESTNSRGCRSDGACGALACRR